MHLYLYCSGESHLAPRHLPAQVRERLPKVRVLTALQNVDALYWRAAGEPSDHVQAVRVAADVVCVFNATPLEKYENYRLYLNRWGRDETGAIDLGPTVYNLIDGLVRFLGINLYSPHNTTPAAATCGPDAGSVFTKLGCALATVAFAQGILRQPAAGDVAARPRSRQCLSPAAQCVLYSQVSHDVGGRGCGALFASCMPGIARSRQRQNTCATRTAGQVFSRPRLKMLWPVSDRGSFIRRGRHSVTPTCGRYTN